MSTPPAIGLQGPDNDTAQLSSIQGDISANFYMAYQGEKKCYLAPFIQSSWHWVIATERAEP